jgi:catechol 2,3-dioxygenase-like lactoylglutathione lyase family enzyme
MPVGGFNHLNIRTPDYEQTLAFLSNALGMSITPVAGRDTIEQAAWALDDRGMALLHLAGAHVPYSKDEKLPDPPFRGSGAIHHVALTCTDYEAMRGRLSAQEVTFRENVPEPGVRQIFVQDPTGITFELNFPGR